MGCAGIGTKAWWWNIESRSSVTDERLCRYRRIHSAFVAGKPPSLNSTALRSAIAR